MNGGNYDDGYQPTITSYGTYIYIYIIKCSLKYGDIDKNPADKN